MRLIIKPAISILSGPKENLIKVREFFSFNNKAAENQIRRFKNSNYFIERKIYESNGGELPEEYLEWKNKKLEELKKDVQIFPCDWKDDLQSELLVPTGIISSLITFFVNENLQLNYEDLRDFENIDKRILTGSKPAKLRKPQEEALLRIDSTETIDFIKGMGLFKIATGVGKTSLAQELIRKIGCRSLFVVPSVPILRQTAKRFEEAYGKKNLGIWGDGTKKIGYVTVATYASIYSSKKEDFDDFRLAIFDECHHVGADTFFAVAVDRLRNVIYRYGLTAFEERADGGTILVEAAVGPTIYSYDAPQAIADNYLAKPTYVIYDVTETKGTWDKYKIKNKVKTKVSTEKSIPYNGDDDNLAYKNWVLGNDLLNSNIAELVAAFVQDGKSVLILVDEIEHGKKLMNLIPNAGYCVGGGKDNERLQKEFNERKLKVLIGTSTLGEGADTVPVDVLIELQGGASKSKTLQADGRALRNDPDENGVPRKPETIIIDFNFPNCKILKRHSALREQVHETMGEIHKLKFV